MSENMENKLPDHIIILRSLISPRVSAAILESTDEEIAVAFATLSEMYGVKAAYTRGTWRQLVRRISAATSQRK